MNELSQRESLTLILLGFMIGVAFIVGVYLGRTISRRCIDTVNADAAVKTR